MVPSRSAITVRIDCIEMPSTLPGQQQTAVASHSTSMISRNSVQPKGYRTWAVAGMGTLVSEKIAADPFSRSPAIGVIGHKLRINSLKTSTASRLLQEKQCRLSLPKSTTVASAGTPQHAQHATRSVDFLPRMRNRRIASLFHRATYAPKHVHTTRNNRHYTSPSHSDHTAAATMPSRATPNAPTSEPS